MNQVLDQKWPQVKIILAKLKIRLVNNNWVVDESVVQHINKRTKNECKNEYKNEYKKPAKSPSTKHQMNESFSMQKQTDSMKRKLRHKKVSTKDAVKYLSTASTNICNNKKVTISAGKKRKSGSKNGINNYNKNINRKRRRSNESEDDSHKENTNNSNKCSSSDLPAIMGLPNLGNTCYVNSIIHVLRATPGFPSFLHSLYQIIVSNNKRVANINVCIKELIVSLHQLFVHLGTDNLLESNKTKVEEKLHALIDCISKRFSPGQQHDSHEFLNWIIDQLNSFAELLHPTQSNKDQNGAKNEITFRSFQGLMRNHVKCSRCERSSITTDSFADIKIPLCIRDKNEHDENDSNKSERQNVGDSPSFTDMIHKKIYLRDENLFHCQNCGQYTEASLVHHIEVSPKVLVVYIERPIGEERNKKWKTTKMYKVPLHLDYVSSEVSKYRLYSFVMHVGSSTNGHYYSVINSIRQEETISTRKKFCCCSHNKINNDVGWIKMNDNKVRTLSDNHLNKLLTVENIYAAPYLAFYSKIK